MFGLTGVELYIFILLSKIIEVSISTLRIILSSKGEKIMSAVAGMIEISIWIVVASSVLQNLDKDPMRGIVYALGFVIGIYFGGKLEQALCIGTVRVNAIVLSQQGRNLAKEIRNNNFAVTLFKGEGMNHPRHLLVMIVKKRRLKELLSILRKYEDNVVIDYFDTSVNYGAYGIGLRK